MKPLVGIIMGSTSDWETMRAAAEALDKLKIPYETRVVSAHRTPDLLFEYASTAQGRGIEVIVDLTGLIDVSAEITRNEQQEKKVLNLIAGKEAKLSNANFTARAPAEVVTKERESLNQLLEQLRSIQSTLADLRQRA